MSSVTHVVDGENEEILNRYEYDAWGNLTTCEEKVPNRFKFNGQQYDPISQQYYLRARYYNPVIGRFTQEDSYNADGLNLYAYCRNNPVYYVDPSGNICETAANRIRQEIADGTASKSDIRKLEAYERYKERIELGEGYYQDTVTKKGEYTAKKYQDKTVAYDGEHYTMSGWSDNVSQKAKDDFHRNEGLVQKVKDNMVALMGSDKVDYTSSTTWKDHDSDYRYYASHAEKQVATYGGDTIGVSKGMCSDCQNYFTAQAQASRQDYVIVDDTYAHIFTKEGEHIKIEK